MSARRGIGLTGLLLAGALLAGATPSYAQAVGKGGAELLEAARAGDATAVRTLLRSGADPNAARGDGLTALHLAAESGHLEVVRALVDAKANVEAKSRIGGYTPLHLAATGAYAEVVRALLDAGANPAAATTTGGATPLHLAAKALNGEVAARMLIERGAPIDAKENASGQTPLMFAASYGRTATVHELVSHGADTSIRTEVVDVLRRAAVDREAQQRLRDAVTEIRGSTEDRPLTYDEEQQAIASARDFLRSQEAMLAEATAGQLDELGGGGTGVRGRARLILVGKTGGLTALHHAAREGRVAAVRELLDAGADVDQRSGDGSTALVLALLNGHFDLALELIDRGANPDLSTETDGVSPLFALLQTQWTLKFTDHPQPRAQDNQQHAHLDVLKALLDAGADPNVRLKTHLWFLEYEGKFGMDFNGATPFWRAAFAQDLESMRMLAEYGADPHIPTIWPDDSMRGGRQEDGRLREDSGLPKMPEGTPNLYPIHAAAGGGYLGLGAFQQNNVPNNFLNSVRFLVEEHGADVDLPDSWGYTAMHFAAVRGGNDLIEYLISKGANVNAVSRLGQTPADMARGGRAGFFSRTPYPETVDLLRRNGGRFECLDTHFRGTGDYCPLSGVEPFETADLEAPTL
jgi:ankyrin repeat protein